MCNFISSEKLWRRDFTLLFSYVSLINFAGSVFNIVLSLKNVMFFCTLVLIINLFLAPLQVLLPIYMTNIGKVEVGFGFLMMFQSAGCILGGTILTMFGNKMNDAYGVAAALGILVVAMLGFVMFQSYYGLLIFMLVIGISIGMINTYMFVLLQKNTPYNFLSRAIGILNTCVGIGSPLVLFLAKDIIKQITLNEVFLCTLVFSSIFLFRWIKQNLEVKYYVEET